MRRPSKVIGLVTRSLETLRKLTRYRRLFGLWNGAWFVVQEAISDQNAEVEVRHANLRHPVRLRLNSTDIRTFQKVVADQEYEIDLALLPRVILDAGANIGLATAFFASKYPAALVVALEPEVSNFRLLKMNTAQYENVRVYRKALWYRSGTILLQDPGEGHWAYRTVSSGSSGVSASHSSLEVEAITVSELMKELDVGGIDILKVDIEGAEKEVFEAAGQWIDQVGVIAIELHDRFKRGCSLAVYSATTGFESEAHRGENVFIVRDAKRIRSSGSAVP